MLFNGTSTENLAQLSLFVSAERGENCLKTFTHNVHLGKSPEGKVGRWGVNVVPMETVLTRHLFVI